MFESYSRDELCVLYNSMLSRLVEIKSRGLSLDMSRGKPGTDQLDLSSDMLNCITANDYRSENGIDCRNYGGLDGLPEMKKIFADLLEIQPDEVIVGGNSSLSMMFDNVAVNMTHGVRDGLPWYRQGQVKFLCPVPGYDRHFSICEYFHIEMIPIEMNENGPDMDMIESLVSGDPMVKGIWCVPFFSNPNGCVYSEETMKRLANLKGAPDFRLYWDNAYFIHNFRGARPKLFNILKECEKAENPNMPLVFTSFSKISFSGAGVAAMASSKSNCRHILKRLAIQTVGPDKLNQLRHARFFKSADGVYSHMEKMAKILRPKFDIVFDALQQNLGGKGIAEWFEPDGGYFVSVDTYDGCARRTVDLCREAGVIITNAGATYPNGNDPRDRNIRLAPTYPSQDDLKQAIEIFCIALQIAALEKIML